MNKRLRRFQPAPLAPYSPFGLVLLGLGAILGLACTSPSQGAGAGLSDPEKRVAVERMYSGYREDFPRVSEIQVDEFVKLREAGSVVLVDVREPEERAIAVIPGSISKDEFEDQRAELSDRTVVVYCTIGYRSGRYVESLGREGIEAFNLAGSILAWVHAGQPVVDPEGNETKKVHVYGSKWDLLPAGYEGVW